MQAAHTCFVSCIHPQAKNAALRDAGAVVPDSFEGLEEAVR